MVMHIKIKNWICVIIIILLFTTVSVSFPARYVSIKNDSIVDTGIIKKSEVEINIRNLEDENFIIEGDKGIELFGITFKKYLALGLPDQFKENDLRVKFTAEINIRDIFTISGFRCIFMRMLPIRIKTIETIDEIPNYTLTVIIDGAGEVSLNPDQQTYAQATEIELTAFSIGNSYGYSEFTYWSGALTGSENPKTITMDSDKTVIAHFVNVISDIALDFDLSLQNIYYVDDAIPITAIITNIGESTVKVSQISIVAHSLNLEIITPDGLLLHYFGPAINGWPEVVTLEPGESDSTVIDITQYFGVGYNQPYDFTKTGVYKIKGYYSSSSPEDDRWAGSLESELYEFTIQQNSDNGFSINSPSDGEIVSGITEIGVSYHNYDPTKVEIAIDRGEWIEVPCLTGYSGDSCFGGGKYSWDTLQVQNGEYTIQARLYERDENYVYASSVDVIVLNTCVYNLTEIDEGSTIYLNVGDKINLTLVTNPSVGLIWYLESYDTSVLNLIDEHEWGYPTTFDAGNITGYPSGAAGKRTWIFETINAGQTKIEIQSRHVTTDEVWEIFTVNIIVNDRTF